MTRRQIALRALKLDHLCDKVIFTPVAEEALCHCQSGAMPLRSEISSRDNLNTLAPTDERRRTGRYVAGGTALAVMLLGLHHVLLRGAYTIAGVCIPTIIMASYIIWVLYSARRDARRNALRYATAIQLTEIVNVPSGRCDDDSRKGPANDGDFGKESRSTRENPAFSDRDEA